MNWYPVLPTHDFTRFRGMHSFPLRSSSSPSYISSARYSITFRTFIGSVQLSQSKAGATELAQQERDMLHILWWVVQMALFVILIFYFRMYLALDTYLLFWWLCEQVRSLSDNVQPK